MGGARVMADLLERLRSATGPDRELDANILVGLKYVEDADWDILIGKDVVNRLSGRTYSHPAPITSSIDACLALAGRALPGCRFALYTDGGGKGPTALVLRGDEPVLAEERGASLPLALLAGVVAALQNNEPPER